MHRAIDLPRSSLTIRTRAVGLLARLAHDLELAARDFSGEIDQDGDNWQAELTFPAGAIRVTGVVKVGGVDRSILSASDIHEIEARIGELLGGQVRVRGQGDRDKGELHVVTARGEQRVRASLSGEDRPDGSTAVSFSTALSLDELGVGPVKGPLGAFKLADEIAVRAAAVLLPGK